MAKDDNDGLNADVLPFHVAGGDNHLQLPRMVATRLREQIISGQLKPGQFLRIEAIAKASGVSMTPVREGLLLLQSEAFVRLIPRRGFVVNSFSKQDLLDLFWAQATIGAELASRAATRMSQADITRLQDLQTEYEAAIKAGHEGRVAALGHQFHRTINLAAASPRLALLLGSLTKQLPNRFYASIEGQLRDAVEYHPVILEAIRLRDAVSAASLMFRHISDGGDHLVAMLERQGAWGEPPADGQAQPKAKKGAVQKASVGAELSAAKGEPGKKRRTKAAAAPRTTRPKRVSAR